MRRGFLLAVLGFGALVLCVVILISPWAGRTFTSRPGTTDSGDGAQTLEAEPLRETNFARPTELPPKPGLVITSANEKASHTNESVLDGREEEHDAQTATRIAQLWDLSTKSDRASLETLLSEVRNPNQEIRQAALDALSQSGNRAALPGLREAAAQTENSQEKQSIVDAIEFMSLPTLTELLSGNGATNNHPPAPERP